jgi:uncharacterized protein (DUF2336 family)
MSEASPASLIADLEGAMCHGPPSRRAAMLRKVTELFLAAADQLGEDQIVVFDEVLTRLIETAETCSLVELATTLSELSVAPIAVVRRLARNAEVEVASPVLAASCRLSERDLSEIAKSRGPRHLLAIARRTALSEALAEVLITRGDADVWKMLANNSKARFSANGYAILVSKAKMDAELAQSLALRTDIPSALLQQLLQQTSRAVRARLLKFAPPEIAEKIRTAIAVVMGEAEAGAPKPFDLRQAEQVVRELSRTGKLVDQTIKRFAIDGELANVVAALALLSSVNAEAIVPLLNNARPDGLIVAARASRLDWSTVSMILRNRLPESPPSEAELTAGKASFESLPVSAAQRAIRFWAERDSIKVKWTYNSRETPVQQIQLSKAHELVIAQHGR